MANYIPNYGDTVRVKGYDIICKVVKVEYGSGPHGDEYLVFVTGYKLDVRMFSSYQLEKV